MHRKFSNSTSLIAIIGAVLALGWFAAFKHTNVAVAATGSETQGALQVVDPSGKAHGFCPLKHTDVKAEISGFLSRVTVTQEFTNPFKEKIEAVYTFPLPDNSAVDDMTMIVGDRTVEGGYYGASKQRLLTKPQRPMARLPACSIRNARIFSLSQWRTSCPASRSGS